MKKRPVLVHVTDHAILRWLEREHGLNVEDVRGHLEGHAMTAAEYGAVAVRIGKVKLVLRDNVTTPSGAVHVAVATVLPKNAISHV